MIWKTVRHEDLAAADAYRIACLKDQHWTHGADSQLRWMADNLRPGDLHLLGEEATGAAPRLLAYMTLTRLRVNVDGAEQDALGVGCVCVDKTALGSGLGKRLVLEANRFIRECEIPGVLLCKDALVPFYQKCGWSLLSCQTASVAGAPYDKRIMTLDRMPACASVDVDRNF